MVVCGTLFVVALLLFVLGVTGLAGAGLGLVYASIAVSLLAWVFIATVVLQRRRELAGLESDRADGQGAHAGDDVADPSGTSAGSAGTRVDLQKPPVTAEATSVLVGPAQPYDGDDDTYQDTYQDSYDDTYDEDDDGYDDYDEEEGGTVLVVPGRPRYHVDGCRYLTAKDVEALDVLAAREEGFAACGVCKPDQVLAARLAEWADEDEDELEDEVEDPDETADAPASRPDQELDAADVPVLLVDPEPHTAVAPAPARATGSSRTGRPVRLAKTTVPAVQDPPPVPPATAAVPARSPRAAGAPGTSSVPGRVPSRSAPVAKGSRSAAAKARSAARAASVAVPAGGTAPGVVLIIPDRGKYHRPECRYVRDSPDAEQATRAVAAQQGYDACGVCRP